MRALLLLPVVGSLLAAPVVFTATTEEAPDYRGECRIYVAIAYTGMNGGECAVPTPPYHEGGKLVTLPKGTVAKMDWEPTLSTNTRLKLEAVQKRGDEWSEIQAQYGGPGFTMVLRSDANFVEAGAPSGVVVDQRVTISVWLPK